MIYFGAVIIIGLILILAWVAICDENMLNVGVAAVGAFAVLGVMLFFIHFPSTRPEVKEAKEIAGEYSKLKNEAYDTKIQHGGVGVELYQKMEQHNARVESKNWKNFWCKVSNYKDGESEYSIDLDEYEVLDGDIPENKYVQPVRIADEPVSTEAAATEPTTTAEKTTEPTSAETEETTLKKVIELNGQYYELVPIG